MATNENHLRTFFDDKLNYTKKHYPTQYLFWRNQKLPLKHTYLSKRFKYVFESDYHKSASYFLDQIWNSDHSAQRASAYTGQAAFHLEKIAFSPSIDMLLVSWQVHFVFHLL
jgi:hypothetical protein